MLIITIQVNAPDGSAQAVKEHLAMYLEQYGDTKVLSIKEETPQQMSFVSQGFQKNQGRGGGNNARK